MGSPYKSGIITFVVGAVLVVLFSLLGWIGFPEIVKSVTISNAKLVNGSIAWDAWEAPPVPITMQFYMFHCNNTEQVMNGSKPILEQKGPYTFVEKRQKTVQSIKDEHIDYVDTKQYIFDQAMSGTNKLSDAISTVNPIYFTLASLIYNTQFPGGSPVQFALLEQMHNLLERIDEHPTMTHTVGEMLFDGWNISRYLDLYEQLQTVANLAGVHLPDLPQSIIEKPFFGLFSKNNTNDGVYTVLTGESDYRDLGRIVAWNHSAELTYWNDKYCNMINGTDGAIYGPMLDKEEPIYVFTTDLCRSIYATYEKEVEHQGIKGNRFTVPKIVFGNYTENPENLCFCRTPNQPEKCFLAGILEMRKCLGGAPVLMSSPHFYMGDDKYINGVVGMSPNKDEHETHFDLEPLSSVPLKASKRIQINIDFQRYNIKQISARVRPIVFPVMWVNESAGVDQETADMLKSDVFGPINALDITRWVLLGISIIVALVGIGLLFNGPKKAKKATF